MYHTSLSNWKRVCQEPIVLYLHTENISCISEVMLDEKTFYIKQLSSACTENNSEVLIANYFEVLYMHTDIYMYIYIHKYIRTYMHTIHEIIDVGEYITCHVLHRREFETKNSQNGDKTG